MGYSERLSSGAVLRFAHGSRYENTLRALGGEHYENALDFGGADGLLLSLACEQGLIDEGVMVDHYAPSVEAAGKRFADSPKLRAMHTTEATEAGLEGSFDLAFCLDVLEHVIAPEEILGTVLRYTKPGARLVVSVPIELGPALLAKQIGRRLAAMRSADYTLETYTAGELAAAVLRRDVKSFPSTHTTPGSTTRDHKGFDYRDIEALLAKHTRIEGRWYSPFLSGGPALSTTIIWTCRT